MNTCKKYIICAPKMSNSNGVRVLYRLSLLLKDMGYEAHVLSPKQSELLNDSYNKHSYSYINYTDITENMRQNDIIIYPEVVKGNPLGFKNVVRWVLYYPGIIGGEKEYKKSECVWAFLPKFYDTGNILSIPTIDTSLFYSDPNIQRNKNAYFVHKGGEWECEGLDFNNMIRITINYPQKRELLADILRHTKVLYSFDNCSILLDEAVMCGCKVYVIKRNGEIEEYHSDYYETYKDWKKQLQDFVFKTQSINNFNNDICRVLPTHKIDYGIGWILLHFLKNKSKANDFFFKSLFPTLWNT